MAVSNIFDDIPEHFTYERICFSGGLPDQIATIKL